MALALVLAAGLWPPPARRVAEAMWVAGMVVGGVLLYAGAHVALGSDEIGLVRRALARLANRRPAPGVP